MPSMYAESLRAFLKPIIPFLDDPDVNEVLVNGPTDIWVEKNGRISRTSAQFSEEGLMAAARNIAQFVGRVLNDERPRLDARLPDGSRIHIVLAPIARKGTTLAIRKFSSESMSMDRLQGLGSVSKPLARLLEAVTTLKQNTIVAGGTGSGKTSLLNVLTAFIPDDERLVTIEDSAELQPQQRNVISFESRPPDKNGKGEVTLGELLNSALRVRPDRIIVGEVRGGECFYLLQAMNTGHSGSLATTHANTPLDALRRLESLCLMSGIELPLVAIRAQVASAVNLVVVCERFPDGTRKLITVSEVLPLNERGDYRVQDLFVYTQTDRDPTTGQVIGYHAPTGVLPMFFERLKAQGLGDLDESFFDPATYRLPQPGVFVADLGERTRWAPSIRARLAGEPVETFEPPRATPKAAVAAPASIPPPKPAPPPPAPVVSKEVLTQDTPPDGAMMPELEPVAPPRPPPPAVKAQPHAPPPPVRPIAPAAPSAPTAPAVREAPSIQVSEELLQEASRANSESTQVRPNPLTPARPAVDDDRTDPQIRTR